MVEASTDTRARMPLLDIVRDDALEREYREAAVRRYVTGGSSQQGVRWSGMLVVAAFGLLITLAAVQSSLNADIRDASRAQLIDRIEENRAELQAEQARAAALRAANAAAEAEAVSLSGSLTSLRARADRIGGLAGFAVVTGPGIRISFDNAAHGDPTNEWVRDSDLSTLVNGLWAAGAEAVAINDQRVIAAGGVRNVGTTVRINGVALAPPYVVTAIGDPSSLAADLLASESGMEFYGLAQTYGWSPETHIVTELRIPGAPAGAGQLRSAHLLDEDPEGEGAQ